MQWVLSTKQEDNMWHIRRDDDHYLVAVIPNEEEAEEYLEHLHAKKQDYSYYKHYVSAA